MGDNRIIALDYLRVIATFGIIICHSCYEFPGKEFIGRLMGLTFNYVFVVLSAFLLGLAWIKNVKPVYGYRYLRKRVGKLSKVYYVYLAILFLFLICTGGSVSIKNIITHILYLPWFDKIDGYGHLWFMTMIVICYVGVVVITKVYAKFNAKGLINTAILVGGGNCSGLILATLSAEHSGIYVSVFI